MQLVGDGVEMFDAMKNRRINRDAVIEKFGVNPELVVDVQALAGDSVDNVPGAPGSPLNIILDKWSAIKSIPFVG